MSRKAIFFVAEEEISAVEPFAELCRKEGFDIEYRSEIPEPEALKNALPDEPAAVFFPALSEDDCRGVKLLQSARQAVRSHVVGLYAPEYPPAEFICLAFHEDADAVIALNSGEERLRAHATRLARRLQSGAAEKSGALKKEIDTLRLECERLEKADAIWKERILSLSSAASRVARGELKMAESPPSLLIAVTAETQARNGADMAQRLGFETRVTHNGADALAEIGKRAPDVILTDGTLPDMDARTLATQARKAAGDKPMVIIAWSGNPRAEEELLAPGSAIDDCVHKSATNEGAGLLTAALLGALR